MVLIGNVNDKHQHNLGCCKNDIGAMKEHLGCDWDGTTYEESHRSPNRKWFQPTWTEDNVWVVTKSVQFINEFVGCVVKDASKEFD